MCLKLLNSKLHLPFFPFLFKLQLLDPLLHLLNALLEIMVLVVQEFKVLLHYIVVLETALTLTLLLRDLLFIHFKDFPHRMHY